MSQSKIIISNYKEVTEQTGLAFGKPSTYMKSMETILVDLPRMPFVQTKNKNYNEFYNIWFTPDTSSNYIQGNMDASFFSILLKNYIGNSFENFKNKFSGHDFNISNGDVPENEIEVNELALKLKSNNERSQYIYFKNAEKLYYYESIKSQINALKIKEDQKNNFQVEFKENKKDLQPTHLRALKKFTSHKPVDLEQQWQSYTQNIKNISFAYFDDQGVLCGFCINYSPINSALWSVAIIKNTHLDPEKRTVTLLGSGEIIKGKGVEDLENDNIKQKILETLNSTEIRKFLSHVFNDDGSYNLSVIENLNSVITTLNVNVPQNIRFYGMTESKEEPNIDDYIKMDYPQLIFFNKNENEGKLYLYDPLDKNNLKEIPFLENGLIDFKEKFKNSFNHKYLSIKDLRSINLYIDNNSLDLNVIPEKINLDEYDKKNKIFSKLRDTFNKTFNKRIFIEFYKNEEEINNESQKINSALMDIKYNENRIINSEKCQDIQLNIVEINNEIDQVNINLAERYKNKESKKDIVNERNIHYKEELSTIQKKYTSKRKLNFSVIAIGMILTLGVILTLTGVLAPIGIVITAASILYLAIGGAITAGLLTLGFMIKTIRDERNFSIEKNKKSDHFYKNENNEFVQNLQSKINLLETKNNLEKKSNLLNSGISKHKVSKENKQKEIIVHQNNIQILNKQKNGIEKKLHEQWNINGTLESLFERVFKSVLQQEHIAKPCGFYTKTASELGIIEESVKNNRHPFNNSCYIYIPVENMNLPQLHYYNALTNEIEFVKGGNKPLYNKFIHEFPNLQNNEIVNLDILLPEQLKHITKKTAHLHCDTLIKAFEESLANEIQPKEIKEEKEPSNDSENSEEFNKLDNSLPKIVEYIKQGDQQHLQTSPSKEPENKLIVPNHQKNVSTIVEFDNN